MNSSYLLKMKNALPWLMRYPFERAGTYLRTAPTRKQHLIFIIANHFEPAWKENGGAYDLDMQRRRMEDWHQKARKIGEAVRDADGTKFRHTNFYPAEQYDFQILEQMAAMQKEGLGEVEIHLHHGVDAPDTAENLRRSLVEFRDCLADEHKCLSRFEDNMTPAYAFVHGNLALANSYGGNCYCGVDEEMQILSETGCYVDMTLPSAPEPTQVPVLNKIYECGLPLSEKIPHRKGKSVAVNGNQPQLPLIFTGPLVFNWSRRYKGIPVPRLEDGGLTQNQPLDWQRLKRWRNAGISVKGRPEWIFVKLYCHGFFDYDQSACIGEDARRFFSEVVEGGEKTGEYQVHFATAREAFNMVTAAIDGKHGMPNDFRDYQLKLIMNEHQAQKDMASKNSSKISAD